MREWDGNWKSRGSCRLGRQLTISLWLLVWRLLSERESWRPFWSAFRTRMSDTIPFTSKFAPSSFDVIWKSRRNHFQVMSSHLGIIPNSFRGHFEMISESLWNHWWTIAKSFGSHCEIISEALQSHFADSIFWLSWPWRSDLTLLWCDEIGRRLEWTKKGEKKWLAWGGFGRTIRLSMRTKPARFNETWESRLVPIGEFWDESSDVRVIPCKVRISSKSSFSKCDPREWKAVLTDSELKIINEMASNGSGSDRNEVTRFTHENG
jgi:hypothetical protein